MGVDMRPYKGCMCEACGKKYNVLTRGDRHPKWKKRVCLNCLNESGKEFTTMVRNRIDVSFDEHMENKILAERLVRMW